MAALPRLDETSVALAARTRAALADGSLEPASA
jgi:hypothetical protein